MATLSQGSGDDLDAGPVLPDEVHRGADRGIETGNADSRGMP
jgi:hypothetical protein